MGSESATRKVAIVGGGISGLAAALELHERDPAVSVTLYEGGDRPGGVLQTKQEKNFLFELGPDSILRRLPWGMQLCERVGLGEQMIPTEPAAAGVYTVYRGRLARMPEGLALFAPQKIWPIVRTPILSWRGKLRMAAERFLPARRSNDDESLAQFARRRFGQEALQRIIQPLAGGIYMGDPELLGMQASFPQLVAAERECGSLIKWYRQAAAKAAKGTDGPKETLFTAPQHGFSQLVDAIVKRLPAGTLRLNHRVEQLTRGERGWRVQGVQSLSGQPFDNRFDWVVLATPAAQTASLIADTDATLAGLLRSIPHTSCVVINLAYPMPAIGRPLDASGIIVPHVERRAIAACTFSSVKYRGRAPQGMALLRVFLGGAHQPHAIDAPDVELLESVRRELRALLRIEGEPVFEQLVRWRDTMPQYLVGHLELVNEIESRVAQWAGLELIGNAYRGVGIPYCIHYAQQSIYRLFSADRGRTFAAVPERSRS